MIENELEFNKKPKKLRKWGCCYWKNSKKKIDSSKKTTDWKQISWSIKIKPRIRRVISMKMIQRVDSLSMEAKIQKTRVISTHQKKLWSQSLQQ